MKNTDNKDYKNLVLFYIIILLVFGVLLVIGTIYDESFAKSIYSPDNLFIQYVTSLGLFPFFSFAVFFFGALCERIIHSDSNKITRIILTTVCYMIAMFVGFIGAGSLFERDCLGHIFPELERNIPVMIGVCTVTNTILLTLGNRLAKKSDDPNLLKRLATVLVMMALAYASMQIFKNTFHRPRFRLIVKGYEGIHFVPWYQPFSGWKEYVEEYGIYKGEFRSFPSGHSILSMSMVFILQSLSWFSEKLKDKKLLLGVAGLVFAIIIIITRLILGAHFISDVSTGAIIAALFGLIYTVIQKRIGGE